MKQLMGICYKSTFVVLMVCLFTGAANAQFGNGKKSGDLPMPKGIDKLIKIEPGVGLTTGKINSPKNLYEAMKAQGVASMISAEDLTADWHVISEDNSRYFNQDDLFYSKGNVFTFGREEFLVAYHIMNPSEQDQQDAQQYYFDQVHKRDSHRTTPRLLKNLQLALSLWPLNRIKEFHEIAIFDPSKDIAEAPPQFLIDRNLSQSNLKQIALALFMYNQDYDEKIPPMVAARSAEHLMYLPSSKSQPFKTFYSRI